MNYDTQTEKNLKYWLDGSYDANTKNEIRKLMESNPQEVTDSFYRNLSFGTGGLRGLMGVGTNRMNVYTIRAATQGLANYILQQAKPAKEHGVFIGYDSRHHSREFAEEAAKVLAGNGIRVYIFKDIRPTPLVSFGVRYKQCTAGIMITASHNPPNYNGYKVYWSDGAQVLPPHDIGIIDEVNKITEVEMVKQTTLDNPLITFVDTEVDEAYLTAIKPLENYPVLNAEKGHELKVVYTSLHGTGITMVPAALKQWGFTNIALVEKQCIPDGSFPTTQSPNPEERAALSLGIETMKQVKGDILIANDPDADRVGIAVMHKGEVILPNGNQIACLCLDFVLRALTENKKLPANAAFIKTIVTTELFAEIAKAYDCPVYNVLTGFKYVADLIRHWELQPKGYQFVFGGEESYGYLLGTNTRDKDAVILTALISEMALHAKLQGKTLIDLLDDIYRKYGLYVEKLLNMKFPETKEGRQQMDDGMKRLRTSPLESIDGLAVIAIDDYHTLKHFNVKTKATDIITLPQSDVLVYWLEDGSHVMVRPSGTEPKIKLYCGVHQKTFDSIPEAESVLNKKAENLLNFVNKKITL